MSPAAAWVAVRGLLLGGALFALLAHVLLLVGAAVPRALLPCCAAGSAAACGWLHRRARAGGRMPPGDGASAPPWLRATTLCAVAVSAVALAFGAVATGDRAWDGVVAWGLKAAALTAEATVAQPLFADPAVFHHSPDYPLLQPLCLAALAQWSDERWGRLLLPALYLLLVATAGLVVRLHTRSGAAACWIALALALVPAFVNTGGGAFDSGYADGFFTLCMTAAAAALLLRDRVLLLAAAAALPLCKPEGTVHLFGLGVACFVAADRRLLAAALCGGAAALCAWLPLQLQLGHRPPAGWPLLAAVIALALAAHALRGALDRRGAGTRCRAGLALLGGAAALLVLCLLRPTFAGHGALLAQYAGGLERALGRLSLLPEIAAGLLQTAATPRRFGLTFGLLAALLLVCGPRARAGSLSPIVVWLGCGLFAVTGAFLLSPEPDVQHHLRSSAGRLLMHFAGIAWLLLGAVLGADGQFAALAGRLRRRRAAEGA